ncbi:unnamed protein product [Brassicogethes aeneus]|uniref:Cyclase n=1 Tax=Brassicogethes aeneus TaxID=1431903 RepID=A0A9P0BH59_BRAAE|nr:unnamed protein product [Brassicogethes aeneus]
MYQYINKSVTMKFSIAILSFFLCFLHYNCVKYVDLSYSFNNNTNYWPTSTNFKFIKKVEGHRDDNSWYAMYDFAAGEHGGTHLDAPYHFNENAWKLGEIPFNRLISQGAFLDLSTVVSASPDPNFQVQPSHLEQWEKINGPFKNGTILLIKFGWSKFWPNKTDYMGLQNGTLNFPGISKAAAQWITSSKKFYGVGVDTASVDPGNSTDFAAHRELSKGYLFNMEMVQIVENLPAQGFKLFALPMKIEFGTGGPLRLVAELDCNC